MKLDPREIWKKAAGRAVAAPGNVASGAVALAASAALWNPLPLILWGLGSAGWVVYASTSEGYTRRILDEERLAAEAEAEASRGKLEAQVGAVLGQPPFSIWTRAGLLPDYLGSFSRLAEIRDRVNGLLQGRQEDYLAGLGIQKQLTYLLSAYLQFVLARVAYLQVLAGEVVVPSSAPSGSPWRPGGGGPRRTVPLSPQSSPAPLPANDPTVPTPFTAPPPRGAPRAQRPFPPAHTSSPPPHGYQLPPTAPITERVNRFGEAARGGAGAPAGAVAGPAGTAAGVPPLPAVETRLAEIEARIAGLKQLAESEPATARTREWHVGILQKQEDLLRDCQSRDQQVVAQLTAVPDVFDVILGRVSASQFSVSEVATYMGGVVEQIEETERFVQAMRPAMDEMLVHMEGGLAG